MRSAEEKRTALDRRLPPTGLAPVNSQGTSVTDSLAAIVKHSELVVQIEHRIAEPIVTSPTGGTSIQTGTGSARRRHRGFGRRARPTDGSSRPASRRPQLLSPLSRPQSPGGAPAPALTTGPASGRSRTAAPRRWSRGRPSKRRREPGRAPG